MCTHPRAAQVELLKWKWDLRICVELGCHPPDLLLAHRAMESIFSAVCDNAEPQLNLRWVSLRSALGLPHLITIEAIQKVLEFAEAELGALILRGGTAQNIGPPLNDNPKTRMYQINDAEKGETRQPRSPHLRGKLNLQQL
ncbi:hypothetical protein N9L68_02385 [bacterium]|nr:hypothetical protein [bacterium]